MQAFSYLLSRDIWPKRSLNGVIGLAEAIFREFWGSGKARVKKGRHGCGGSSIEEIMVATVIGEGEEWYSYAVVATEGLIVVVVVVVGVMAGVWERSG